LKKSVLVIILLAFSLAFSCHNVNPTYASEPTRVEALNHLGFTNVVEADVETFQAGVYNITLYAEFAAYCDQNEISYYSVNTSTYNILFTGPEGGFGYLPNPITKNFTAHSQFSLSLLSPGPNRYFVEHSQNPDGEIHAKVYRNLDDPRILLLCFEDLYQGGDKDYQDVVISIQLLYSLEFYLTVMSPYDTPIGQGWYYNDTAAFASLEQDIVDHGNGTRRVFAFWSGDASGTNYSRSEPIYMQYNKTAVANWKTQYYLTVNSSHGSPTPMSGWFDAGAFINASVTSIETSLTGTRYLCIGWTGTGSVPASGTATSLDFTINAPSSITWNWKTQYLFGVLTDPRELNPQPLINPLGDEHVILGYYWYDASTNVNLTAQTVAGYAFDYWDVDGISQGSGIIPIIVNIDAPHVATAHYLQSQPLSVHIYPLSATIQPDQSVNFTSTTSGGTQLYIYQWFLNGAPIANATSNAWIFSPTAEGTYYVFLRVVDNRGNVAESEIARIEVFSIPVGGYSISLDKPVAKLPFVSYAILLTLLGAIIILVRRKRK
jgi:hypothetical protein